MRDLKSAQKLKSAFSSAKYSSESLRDEQTSSSYSTKDLKKEMISSSTSDSSKSRTTPTSYMQSYASQKYLAAYEKKHQLDYKDRSKKASSTSNAPTCSQLLHQKNFQKQTIYRIDALSSDLNASNAYLTNQLSSDDASFNSFNQQGI